MFLFSSRQWITISVQTTKKSKHVLDREDQQVMIEVSRVLVNNISQTTTQLLGSSKDDQFIIAFYIHGIIKARELENCLCAGSLHRPYFLEGTFYTMGEILQEHLHPQNTKKAFTTFTIQLLL